MGVLNAFIHLLQGVLDLLFELANYLFIKRDSLPPIISEDGAQLSEDGARRSDILLHSGTELAARIRSRKLTSELVVKTFIERIQSVNPILNCFIMKNNRFEDALREAQEIDRQLDTDPNASAISEDNKPLLGVPFTSKESFFIKGLPNSSGMVSLKDRLSKEDAPVVERLKEAGGIALGVTTVPELCMWWETSNFVYGRTNNAYDSRRIVGGSSGGEACLISAAGSVWGIGSDIGGSIRMPAFFNGIFGHKPSRHQVPNGGKFPGDPKNDEYVFTGPLCRYAEDLIPMLKVMAGPSNSAKLNLDQPVDLKKLKLRVYSVPDVGDALGVSKISKELQQIQNRVEHVLRTSVDAIVNPKLEESKCFDGFKDTFSMWNSSVSLTGSPSFCQMLGLPSDDPINPWKELLLWFCGLSDHTFPAIAIGLKEKLNNVPTAMKERHALKARQLGETIHKLLGEDGILLLPSSADYAYFHHQPIYKLFNCVYTMIFNVLGFPVTQVPLGLGEKGVPLGIQVVAAHHNDRLCLAVAKHLEYHFGGWVKPVGT